MAHNYCQILVDCWEDISKNNLAQTSDEHVVEDDVDATQIKHGKVTLFTGKIQPHFSQYFSHHSSFVLWVLSSHTADILTAITPKENCINAVFLALICRNEQSM